MQTLAHKFTEIESLVNLKSIGCRCCLLSCLFIASGNGHQGGQLRRDVDSAAAAAIAPRLGGSGASEREWME